MQLEQSEYVIHMSLIYMLLERGNLMSTRYKIIQKLISIGDDFWIENQDGKKVFKVDGKALRLRETLLFEDINGKELCKIQQRLLAITDTMAIEGPNGEQLALIKKALISPLRDRWSVNVSNGSNLDVQGDILNHEYSIKQDGQKIAEVSKKWFAFTDTYGVEIHEGQNDILVLAIAIAIDMMVHEEHEKKQK